MLKSVRRANQPQPRETRFSRVFARDSIATELLHGCPVVTAEGTEIGCVNALLIDRRTNQLRYVILAREGSDASIAIPWQTLYFDSALARLVFYTYS
jgi:hypothetical protein